MKNKETIEEVKDLAYYKANAEEDYLQVPISVLRYISQLEQQERSYSEEDMIATFHYGHQIGMNSILSIQSQHSPQPMPKPDLEVLKKEWLERFKKK